MLSWNFIFLCVLAFSVLPFNGAQRHKSLEKSASASDEEQFIRGQSREHYGVYEVERCLRDDIRAKLCDMDNLLNDTERNLINSALNEFESNELFREGSVKLAVLLFRDIKDAKETDRKIFELIKQHIRRRPTDRVAVLVLSVGSDFRDLNREYMSFTDKNMNVPIYYYFPAGVWSSFHSTNSLNVWVSPAEMMELYSNQASMLREGTYGTVLLNIIHGIWDKILAKQKQLNVRTEQRQTRQIGNEFEIESKGDDEVRKVERCLLRFEAKICDPNGLLNANDQSRIDDALEDLERSTRARDSGRSTFQGTTCTPEGIKLAVIILDNVKDADAVDRRINELLNRHYSLYRCQRPAVMMLSPGPDYRRRFGEVVAESKQQPSLYQYVYPNGVWSKFYAISSRDVPVTSGEIVSLYDMEKPLIRQGQYARALLNIISNLKDRVMARRLVRQTGFNFEQHSREEHTERQQFGVISGEEKNQLLKEMCDYLNNIKPMLFDPKCLISKEDSVDINEALKRFEQETTNLEVKRKGFVLTVVMLPFIEDSVIFKEFEDAINEGLHTWRQAHRDERAAVIMLSASGNMRGKFNPSKFYGISTLDSLIRPQELVSIYKDNKRLIREGRIREALMEIIKLIHEQLNQGTSRIDE